MVIMKAINKYLILPFIALVFIASFYIQYEVEDSCRFLSSIASDKELNQKLKVELETFINSGDVPSIVSEYMGRVLEADSLRKNKLTIKLLEDKTDSRDLEVFLARSSSRKITHIGVGYARGYILYKLDKMTKDRIDLTEDSKIKCLVYKNE